MNKIEIIRSIGAKFTDGSDVKELLLRIEKDNANIELKDGVLEVAAPTLCPVVTSFGRYVRRRLEMNGQLIDDTKLSMISNHLMLQTASEVPNNGIEIISGRDIFDVYSGSEFPHSCMSEPLGKWCTKFYAEQSNVRMIIVRNKSCRSRAILWNTDQGHQVCDRIYSSHDFGIGIIYDYCERNGILIRDNSDCFEDTVTVKRVTPFPYLDTFRYGESKRSHIILHHYSSKICRGYDEESREAFKKRITICFEGTVGFIRYVKSRRWSCSKIKCHICGRQQTNRRASHINYDIALCRYCAENAKRYCYKCYTSYFEDPNHPEVKTPCRC